MNFDSFPVGPFIVSVGGIITFIGIILASWVLIRTVRDEEVSLKFLSDHLLLFVVIPLFLGRFGAFLSLWNSIEFRLSGPWYTNIGEIFRSFFLFGNSGIRSDWAVGGFFVVFFVLAFWRKQKHFAWLDAFILPGVVISIFVSLGGYFSGWGYGKPAPDWLKYPFVIEYNMTDVRYSGSLYAVQLYATVLLSIIFLIGWYLWKRKIWRRWKEGKFFAVMLFVLGIVNAFLEFFRGDSVTHLFGIRLPIFFGLSIAIGSLIFLIFRRDNSLLERIQKDKTQQ